LIGGTGDPEKRTDTAKWDHVWKLIVKHEAQTGKGIDQKIANEHNKICAAKINDRTVREDQRQKNWYRSGTNTNVSKKTLQPS